MQDDSINPLLTLFVCSYQQETFIRDAIEGAFAQTYSPLEIILSDDYSPDGTFEEMQRMAAAYAGPHLIRLNRNPRNLGICGHINKICELARGEWIVAAAGDDISLPNRVEAIWNTVRSRKRAGYVISYALSFSGNRPSTTLDLRLLTQPLGATEAFRRTTFERFGALDSETFNEDWALYFRAELEGRDTILVEEPLILYRDVEVSLTKKLNSAAFCGTLDVHAANLRQFRRDVNVIAVGEPERAAKLQTQIDARLHGCALLNEALVNTRKRVAIAKKVLQIASIPSAVRMAIALMAVAPFGYRWSNRLATTRFAAVSPSRMILNYLNPLSLLPAPISLPGDAFDDSVNRL